MPPPTLGRFDRRLRTNLKDRANGIILPVCREAMVAYAVCLAPSDCLIDVWMFVSILRWRIRRGPPAPAPRDGLCGVAQHGPGADAGVLAVDHVQLTVHEGRLVAGGTLDELRRSPREPCTSSGCFSATMPASNTFITLPPRQRTPTVSALGQTLQTAFGDAAG
jgi:hypothetical protein